MVSTSTSASSGNLSARGEKNRAALNDKLDRILELFRNQWSPENPDGYIIMGVADNCLCRPELVKFFNSGALKLIPEELGYADHIFTSGRLLDALCMLFNTVPDGIPDGKPGTDYGGSPPPLITQVKPQHLILGSGASGMLDALFWAIAEPNDGVLVSTPYYNAFDHDLTARAATKIIPVTIPPAETVKERSPPEKNPKGSQKSFAPETVKCYQKAMGDASAQGINCRVLLVCNPHNPSGAVYPRETLVELAKFSAKHNLHMVVDEIYARSVYTTKESPNPTQFVSILSIDVQKEAGLDPSRVHVVTSASKDFAINGFRLGVIISQHNPMLIRSLTSTGMLGQTAAPSGHLWASLLLDKPFLTWFLEENRRRMSASYDRITAWARHHGIPYVPGTAGHFLLMDMTSFLKAPKDASEEELRKAEGALTARFLEEEHIFLAPGAQYHCPTPGLFRVTFTVDPATAFAGLQKVEKVLGLDGTWLKSVGPLNLLKGSKPSPTEAKIAPNLPSKVADFVLRLGEPK